MCHVVGATGEWEIEGEDSGPRLIAEYFTFSNKTLFTLFVTVLSYNPRILWL